mmetsp:Transcript_89/g.376  ORF Transcript_89/g.376 Transcript_89/m.376 type:complete len:718 (-) Transcript_89:79-2232(-)
MWGSGPQEEIEGSPKESSPSNSSFASSGSGWTVTLLPSLPPSPSPPTETDEDMDQESDVARREELDEEKQFSETTETKTRNIVRSPSNCSDQNSGASPETWAQRLLRFLSESFENSSDLKDIKQNWKVGVALTVFSYFGYRHVAKPLVQFLLRRLKERRFGNSTNSKSPDFRKLAVEVPLSTLYRAMAKGIVEKALVGTNVVYYSTRHQNGVSKLSWNRSSLPPRNSQVQSDILDRLSSVPSSGCAPAAVTMLQEKPTLMDQLATPFWASLPFVYLGLLYRMLTHLHRNTTLGANSDMSKKTADIANSSTTFDDVGGLNDILSELQQVIAYGQHPARFQSVGAIPPKGILLHGPPGTGKTLLARALVGQSSLEPGPSESAVNPACTVDSFTVCSASEFVEVYVGRGASRIRSLFSNARRTALNNYQHKLFQCKRRHWLWETCHKLFSPNGEVPFFSATDMSPYLSALQRRKPTALIFIDELDAVAKRRDGGAFGGSSTNDEREQTLNQLLTEMDGYHNDISREENDVLVIVMAASNRAQVLDPAILRRFDLQLAIPKPDLASRTEILRIHVSRRFEKSTANHGEQRLDYDRLASLTDGLTGSDLKTIVNDATLLALRQGSAQQVESLSPNYGGAVQVAMGHFEDAIRRFRKTKQYAATLTDSNGASVLTAFHTRQSDYDAISTGTYSQPTPLRSNKSSAHNETDNGGKGSKCGHEAV